MHKLGRWLKLCRGCVITHWSKDGQTIVFTDCNGCLRIIFSYVKGDNVLEILAEAGPLVVDFILVTVVRKPTLLQIYVSLIQGKNTS